VVHDRALCAVGDRAGNRLCLASPDRETGVSGLLEHSRAAHRHVNQTPEDMSRWLSSCGKRICVGVLKNVSACSSATKRAGVGRRPAPSARAEARIVARKKRLRTAPYTEPLAHANEANRVWCADFKGWFRTADGARIDPLTISDAHSGYLLRCQAVEKTNTDRV
jgi:putative transposase